MLDFASMPKVELHLHLEGAIPLPALWELVERKGGSPGLSTPADLAQRFAYRDFAHFIETWVWKNQFLDNLPALEFAAEAVARHLADQQIVYAEAHFSPTDVGQYGLEPAGVALAIRRGLDRVEGTRVALIADLVRDTGPDRAARTLAQVAEVAVSAGIVGIGIGGSEAEYPPGPFAPVYRRGRELGFRLTAHAGEAAGPESVWGALRELDVDRVGHGVRSVEDPELVRYLVDRQVPLEVCPSSNLRTGIYAGWDQHPLPTLVAAGAMVTINTDDPAMFHTDLAGEYGHLVRDLGLAEDIVVDLAANAIDASWAGSEDKVQLHRALRRWRRSARA